MISTSMIQFLFRFSKMFPSFPWSSLSLTFNTCPSFLWTFTKLPSFFNPRPEKRKSHLMRNILRNLKRLVGEHSPNKLKTNTRTPPPHPRVRRRVPASPSRAPLKTLLAKRGRRGISTDCTIFARHNQRLELLAMLRPSRPLSRAKAVLRMLAMRPATRHSWETR